jgi:transcriptional regulator with XRE-family HTH domain
MFIIISPRDRFRKREEPNLFLDILLPLNKILIRLKTIPPFCLISYGIPFFEIPVFPFYLQQVENMVQTQPKEQNHSLIIGRRVREVRKSKALTIKETALGVGVSVGLISQIENEQVTPAISTLMKIASFLGVDITYFFQAEERTEAFTVVRAKERFTSSRRGLEGNLDLGYTYESLAFKQAKKHMEPFVVTFNLQEKKDIVFFSHEGEEFVHIMEGKVEFCIEDKTTVLGQNDSLYFDSHKPHGYRAIGSRPCRALVVIYNKRP